jgi:hypothetical protein
VLAAIALKILSDILSAMNANDPFGDPVNVTPDVLRNYAGKLREIAALHEAHAAALAATDAKGLSVKNLKSAAGALAALGKFLGAVTEEEVNGISADAMRDIYGGVEILNRSLKRIKDETDKAEEDHKRAAKLARATDKKTVQPPVQKKAKQT